MQTTEPGTMAGALLLDRCRVVDPVSGRTSDGLAVAIVDGMITAVDRAGALRPRAGQVVLDLAGRVVTPGLWDVHCHPGMHPDAVNLPFETAAARRAILEDNLRDGLAAGITGVRITGEAHGVDLLVRGGEEHTREALPEILACGPAIKRVGGHGHRSSWPPSGTPGALTDPFGSHEVDGIAAIVERVHRHADDGVDWIKLFVTGGIAGSDETPDDLQLSSEELRAACSAAEQRGLPVAAHLGNPRATRLAVEAGVRSVEHGYRLDEVTVELMAAAGAWYVPTLGISHAHEHMREMGWPEEMIERARRIAPEHRRSLELAVRAGVRIASGSDMRPLATAAVNEIILLAEAGLGAAGALRAATVDAAVLCGRGDSAGQVLPGRVADLVVTAMDPLIDLRTLREPHLVLRAGRPISGGDS